MDAVPVQRASVLRRIAGNSYVHIALIAIVGLLAYSNSFDAPFYFDDMAFLENPQVRSLASIPDIFMRPEGKFASRPLMHATFALNFAVGTVTSGHMDTTGFHVMNVALHLLNGILLYVLVIMTAGLAEMDRTKAGQAAFFISAVFVLHPVQVEAVTYLVSRSMLISTTFYLLGTILFIKAVASGRRKFLYSVCLFAASLLGMGSRENFATFPLMLILYDVFFISKFNFKEALSHYKAYVTVFLSLGYMVFLITKGHTYDRLTEMPGSGLPHSEYLVTQFAVVWTYIRLLFFPVNQNLDYDYSVAKTLFEFPTIFAFMGYLGLWAGAALLARRRPVASFGVLWFLLTLVPVSFGVAFLDLRLDDVIFEHRLYLASIGFIGVLGAGAFVLLDRLGTKEARVAMISLLAIIPLVLCSATYARNALWSDHIGMWEDTVAKSPRKARPHNNLGQAYYTKGFNEKAEEHFEKAIALDPFYADPHFNLGSIYYRRGMHEEAAEQFNYTVYAKPEDADAHLNLALALAATGARKKAERHLKIAASLRPYPEAHYNLGVLYMKNGNRKKARREFGRALALNPGYVDARRFLEFVSKPDNGPPH